MVWCDSFVPSFSSNTLNWKFLIDRWIISANQELEESEPNISHYMKKQKIMSLDACITFEVKCASGKMCARLKLKLFQEANIFLPDTPGCSNGHWGKPSTWNLLFYCTCCKARFCLIYLSDSLHLLGAFDFPCNMRRHGAVAARSRSSWPCLCWASTPQLKSLLRQQPSGGIKSGH